MANLVYLAAPYSDPDLSIRTFRFNAVNVFAGKLIQEGLFVFSPISHCHPIAIASGLPTNFDYWQSYNHKMLSCCDKLLVFRLPGWDKSIGVAAEIKMAESMNIPVEYRD